jgi:alanyl-tRNA synthetase
MTLRLYRNDAYLTSFSAHVIRQLTHKGQLALILDRTAFYPTAGGQPNDLGAINGHRVVDVLEYDDEIIHVLRVPPQPNPLSEVEGVIDWPRRFDHMQQHSGQHVLSQAFVRVANLDTIAVHIGADDNTLDLPTPHLAPQVIEQAEREANAIVAEDRPFVVYEVADADLPNLPLRRPPKVLGRIRIVEVKDYDWSACGGTHVRNTAQIGLIKITRAEKRGNDTRVTFRCGGRAIADYARLNATINRLMETFSASRYEVEQAVQRLAAGAAADRKALQEARETLIAYEAAELLASTQPSSDGVRLIIRAFELRDPVELRSLAKQLINTSNVVALLGASGEKAQLIFARSKDSRGDMATGLRVALATLSPEGKAKGGGSADFAQGGGVPADSARVLAAIAVGVETVRG